MDNSIQSGSVISYGYATRKNTLQRKSDRNAARALQFEEAMFNHRSRYLILVLTLSYQQQWRNTITLDTIRQHRDNLLNNRRCNQLLEGINGYIWKIEEGQNSGGLHLHVVIFYDGECRADIYFAQLIGEYWVNVITQGKGAYWNSNAQKDCHASHGHGIGTGQIDRHNDARRTALRQNLLYLAKNDQQASNCMNPHFHMFGTSQFPT